MNITLITSQADVDLLQEWLELGHDVLAVDTETTGLDWTTDTLRTVQVADDEHAFVIPADKGMPLIAWFFNVYRGDLIFQNWKFDWHFLYQAGAVDFPPGGRVIHDTMTLSHLQNPALNTSLKERGRRIFPGVDFYDKRLKEVMSDNGWEWATVPIDDPAYWEYSGVDALLTYKLWESLQGQYPESIYDLEMKSQMALWEMEQNGVLVDLEYLDRKAQEFEKYMTNSIDWAKYLFGIDLRSRKQVTESLIKQGWEASLFTATGQVSLSREALKDVPLQLAQTYLEFRKAEKFRSTFFLKLLERNRYGIVHPDIISTGARTGRMSMRNPNLQQVPRSAIVRDAFIARPGQKLILADYDAMEFRVIAQYSQDPGLIEATESADIHSTVARMVWGQKGKVSDDMRQRAKTMNYSLMYGAGAKRLALTMGIPIPEAHSLRGLYFDTFSGLAAFQDGLKQNLREGPIPFTVMTTTRDGRRLVVDDSKSFSLLNYLIQGTCADILKAKIYAISETSLGQYLRLAVHDELMLEVPEGSAVEAARKLESLLLYDRHRPYLTVQAGIYDRWGDKYR